MAVIADQAATLKIDTRHLRELGFRIGSIFQFIGEVHIQPHNERQLATDLQNLSVELQKKQSNYLKRLRQQMEVMEGTFPWKKASNSYTRSFRFCPHFHLNSKFDQGDGGDDGDGRSEGDDDDDDGSEDVIGDDNGSEDDGRDDGDEGKGRDGEEDKPVAEGKTWAGEALSELLLGKMVITSERIKEEAEANQESEIPNSSEEEDRNIN
ncbi:hypothetical protein V6N13_009635 [Hibiscus sabdariffa]|uniref:Uncharacterized protein n=1 Tax=Hibiscus sabdariffa TaxID=183260 RepID=A0ABR2NNP2_9ROSI